ncbi:MAG: ABC transporter permease [Lachnospiraceae bacterium]|nr:ABC transporter permease [Lachnospiraceae bacterium]
MRSIVFAKRTGKEILRDPLTFVFSLGFPILMLIIMTVIDRSLPPEAGMEIFHLPYLAPGITIFGLTFIMLFTCLQVSKDRSTAFLIRLYASPMKPGDFVAGYTLPLLGIALLQTIITFAAAFITAAITGDTLHLGNVVLGIILSIPAALLFLSFGMLFGTILNEKAAPGICSILITAASMLGGIWMDVDALGGTLLDICKILPFYHCVKTVRLAVLGNFSQIGAPLAVTCIYAVVIYLLAVLALRCRMQQDVK